MVSIIINPVSGGSSPARAERRASLASSMLTASGERGEVWLTERRGHGHDLAVAAARRGDRLVIAWGGDGTVNEIASALVRTQTSLGIVPAGSGNGLARELGVPSAAAAALSGALSSSTRVIDAAQFGGRWFFSVAGVGFDAHVASAFDRVGGRRGLAGYVLLTARELWRYRCLSYRIDSEPERPALLVTFANTSQFGNGARIAPSARLDDGLLDLVRFEERSRLATVCQLPLLFTGGVGRVRGVSVRRVVSTVVESRAPMLFHVDGEPVQGGTRLEARIHPAVLRVAVAARHDRAD